MAVSPTGVLHPEFIRNRLSLPSSSQSQTQNKTKQNKRNASWLRRGFPGTTSSCNPLEVGGGQDCAAPGSHSRAEVWNQSLTGDRVPCSVGFAPRPGREDPEQCWDQRLVALSPKQGRGWCCVSVSPWGGPPTPSTTQGHCLPCTALTLWPIPLPSLAPPIKQPGEGVHTQDTWFAMPSRTIMGDGAQGHCTEQFPRLWMLFIRWFC